MLLRVELLRLRLLLDLPGAEALGASTI